MENHFIPRVDSSAQLRPMKCDNQTWLNQKIFFDKIYNVKSCGKVSKIDKNFSSKRFRICESYSSCACPGPGVPPGWADRQTLIIDHFSLIIDHWSLINKAKRNQMLLSDCSWYCCSCVAFSTKRAKSGKRLSNGRNVESIWFLSLSNDERSLSIEGKYTTLSKLCW